MEKSGLELIYRNYIMNLLSLNQVQIGFEKSSISFGSADQESILRKLFLQIRFKLFEYIAQENILSLTDRTKFDAELMLEDVIGFFKDILGSSFRPLSDLCITQLFKFRIDLLKWKLEQEKLEG